MQQPECCCYDRDATTHHLYTLMDSQQKLCLAWSRVIINSFIPTISTHYYVFNTNCLSPKAVRNHFSPLAGFGWGCLGQRHIFGQEPVYCPTDIFAGPPSLMKIMNDADDVLFAGYQRPWWVRATGWGSGTCAPASTTGWWTPGQWHHHHYYVTLIVVMFIIIALSLLSSLLSSSSKLPLRFNIISFTIVSLSLWSLSLS